MITNLAAGFALGWVGSMPIAGAVSIFVFQRGLAGRVKAGMSLSAGAAVAEAAWCLLAMLGAEQIMIRWPGAEGIAKIVGAVILLGLGGYFLTRKSAGIAIDENSSPAENHQWSCRLTGQGKWNCYAVPDLHLDQRHALLRLSSILLFRGWENRWPISQQRRICSRIECFQASLPAAVEEGQ